MADNTENRYDVIVAGTGPGGATVALELAKKGKKVLMLEWGRNRRHTGRLIHYVIEQAVPGRSLLFTYRLLGMVRGITTGGSSEFYYATCFDVPYEMLKERGIDITGHVKEARRELHVGPLKDEMITPMAARIMESAQELGYDWQKLDKFMFQERWKPEYRFGYYGDPHNVKWSARMYVNDALALGAELVTGAKVRRVLCEGGLARGVEYRKGLKKYKVFADKIVIAAGGIGSPVILRKSGIPEAGYDFFYDPLVSVCGKMKDMRKQKNEIPMSAGMQLEEEGYIMTDMAVPDMLDNLFAAEVFRFHRMFESRKTIRIMIKARDSLGGRLTDSGGVRKALAPEDREKLMKGARQAREILEKAGATGIYTTWYLAAHPGGTVKAGDLIDEHLETKKFKGLYVCDCSVIPGANGLPPTMTLIGLGRYLAEHLALES